MTASTIIRRRTRRLAAQRAVVSVAVLGVVAAYGVVNPSWAQAATLTGSSNDGFTLDADLAHQSPQTGRSRLTARGAVVDAGDSYAARDLSIRLDPVQVALARAFAPDLPLGGVVSGTATLNGTPAALQLAADLVHESSSTGRSRLVANGGLSLGEEVRARNLRLRADPVQVDAVDRLAGDAAAQLAGELCLAVDRRARERGRRADRQGDGDEGDQLTHLAFLQCRQAAGSAGWLCEPCRPRRLNEG